VLLHEPMSSGWALRRMDPALAKRDLGIVTALVALFGVLPFGEELLRTIRGRHVALRAQVAPESEEPGTLSFVREATG